MKYVLITPARNEARFIEETIKSVTSQTVLPLKWVIVSDGSTDGTDEIVKKYESAHPWLELVRMPQRIERHFSGKALAFNTVYGMVMGLPYDVIGNLDADITFDPEYFEYLLGKFERNPKLGVAGTPFREGEFQYDYDFVSIDHVSGACQLFRKECFEEISGYRQVKEGGIDLIAVVSARMKGWQTRTYTDKVCIHHRKMGTENHRVMRARFQDGKKDYYLGGHPVWEVFRCIYQMKTKPYVIGGLSLLAGYAWSFISRVKRPIPPEFVNFRRKEQMMRLRNKLLRAAGPGFSR